MAAVTAHGIRELDHRSSDGIEVELLWSRQTNQTWIAVADARNGERFAFEIEPSAALDAFRHPYAYA
jgi:hypothetical protein